MNDAYSPHTLEHIQTDNPAPWMGRAGVAAPAYNAQTQGCFWRDDVWEVVDVVPVVEIPEEVTPAQGLMALYVLKDITEDDVLAAIGTIPDATLRYQAQIAYGKATSWQRYSTTMQVTAALLALTEQDMDDLFMLAVTFENI
ncbi:hypothetical protein H0A64_15945 [Alcaligenaceae bacterium]|nr:hypothetical protein [Alcaligenaceae bacterium]